MSIYYTLPGQDKTKPAIVVRFVSRKLRNNVLMQVKKKLHLTKKNANIAQEARLLKKQKKITLTWTRNGYVWIKVKEQSQPKIIKEMKDLEKLK